MRDRRAWQDVVASLLDQLLDDDVLTHILLQLPAEDARAAFSVSKRWHSKGPEAREARFRCYWYSLFHTPLGFPTRELVLHLTAADAVRFEARLQNLVIDSKIEESGKNWRCLSCLRPSPMRLGGFCIDCVGDESAFVKGGGQYVDCDVTCGHEDLVYFCPLCEASTCRSCLMGGACTFCLLLVGDSSACEPCDIS